MKHKPAAYFHLMRNTFKIILYTLLITGTIIILAYKSVLGVFGMGVESIETLANLKNSHKTVQRIKQTHIEKKNKIRKKYIKRGKKRLASASGGVIPVVGSLIVAGAVVKFSVDEYCEEQKELADEENILYDTQIEFSKDQCWASTKDDFYKMITGSDMPENSG